MTRFKTPRCLKITQNVPIEFWHFPPIFVLLKLTCLVTLFDRKLQVFENPPNWTIFGIFPYLLSTQHVNLDRFARNAEWDFFCHFQTLWTWVVGLCAAFFLASYTCLTKIAMVNMNVPSLMSVGGPLRANEIIFFIQTSKLNNYLPLSQISLAFLLCCHASADV